MNVLFDIPSPSSYLLNIYKLFKKMNLGPKVFNSEATVDAVRLGMIDHNDVINRSNDLHSSILYISNGSKCHDVWNWSLKTIYIHLGITDSKLLRFINCVIMPNYEYVSKIGAELARYRYKGSAFIVYRWVDVNRVEDHNSGFYLYDGKSDDYAQMIINSSNGVIPIVKSSNKYCRELIVDGYNGFISYNNTDDNNIYDINEDYKIKISNTCAQWAEMFMSPLSHIKRYTNIMSGAANDNVYDYKSFDSRMNSIAVVSNDDERVSPKSVFVKSEDVLRKAIELYNTGFDDIYVKGKIKIDDDIKRNIRNVDCKRIHFCNGQDMSSIAEFNFSVISESEFNRQVR